MCYQGKCMHCLNVETGTLIFAIINIIITSLGILSSLGGFVYINFIMEVSTENAKITDGHTTIEVAQDTNELLAMAFVGYSVAFAFTVVLIFGVCKRKAILVKIYYMYGIVCVVLGIAVIIGSYIYSLGLFIRLLCLVYAIYSPILYMIRMTYKKFEQEDCHSAVSNPITAIEKC